jgi:hypothetical protein
MGSTVPGAHTAQVTVRGATADRLSWIDATGEIATTRIESDDWRGELPLEKARGFIRCEIIADASRERLVAEFLSTTDGRELPWQLRGADIGEQPIRRALSNPIYLG